MLNIEIPSAEVLKTLFSYAFVLRAVAVGILTSLCAALIGVGLVLKRYSMIGDGLSHVGFGALTVAAAAGLAPMRVAVPVILAAAVLLLKISENGKIKGDSAVALISVGALSIGVIAVSFSTGMNADVSGYLFGSILTLTHEDLILSVLVSAAVLTAYVLFYNKIFAVTFDPAFSKASGLRTDAYNMLISVLTALVVTVGMRMMGAMLISGLMIFPPLTAMRVFKSFRAAVIASAVISAVCFIAGFFVSVILSTPASATVVAVNIIAFIIFWTIGGIRERVRS
ncbi:MAG: metal ABC transporter permease [Clostridiales bacterium]|jgi:zinc transport system permease protein|nr:metal ABC transporter permease [Clostridiales bacterium]